MPFRVDHFSCLALLFAAFVPVVPTSAQAQVSYQGGVVVKADIGEDHSLKMKLNGRTQLRFGYAVNDGGDDSFAFSVPRSRLKLSGHLYANHLKYFFQIDFGKGSVALKDAGFDYVLFDKALSVRAGQFKKPFGREQLTSSSKLDFVDRSMLDKAFGSGRDIGVMIHNGFGKKSAFEYAAGLFNGTGVKGKLSGSTDAGGDITGGKFSNVPGQMKAEGVLRVGYNYNGIRGYDGLPFGDKDRAGFRFAVGGAARYAFGADDSNSVFGGQLDAVVRFADWSFAAAYHARLITDDVSGDTEAEGLELQGLQLQTGYLFDDSIQPALRLAHLWFEQTDVKRSEYQAALNIYVFGHAFKWSTDFTVASTSESTADTTDYRLRSQVQIGF